MLQRCGPDRVLAGGCGGRLLLLVHLLQLRGSRESMLLLLRRLLHGLGHHARRLVSKNAGDHGQAGIDGRHCPHGTGGRCGSLLLRLLMRLLMLVADRPVLVQVVVRQRRSRRAG